MEWFEKEGCPLKVERGERVFPVSDHASDVIKALAGQLGRLGVQVRLRTEVKGLVTEPDGAGAVADEKMPVRLAAVKGVRLTDGTVERADAVIVATGGLSYPLTGSTGDGYRMAEETGHTVKPTFPSLVPFRVREPWCGQLQGLSLKNVSLRLVQNGKKPVYEGFGEMLFTHFGVSGPLVLSASSFYAGQKKKGEDRKSVV